MSAQGLPRFPSKASIRANLARYKIEAAQRRATRSSAECGTRGCYRLAGPCGHCAAHCTGTETDQ